MNESVHIKGHDFWRSAHSSKMKLPARYEPMAERQTLKTVLALWSDATEAFSVGDFDDTIDKFLQVEDLSARMLYNMACAYTRLNKMTLTLQCLSAAVKKDEHLAIAYFQRGVINLKQNSFKGAVEDFIRAKTLMRANSFIDYKPLGMSTKLWNFEILYNLALAHLQNNSREEAETLFTEALHDSDIRQRKLLIAALEHVQENRPDLISPIEISVNNIFTPPKSVRDNLVKKHVIESAKVVMAADKDDTDPSFNGMKRLAEIRLKSPPGTPKPKRSPQSPLMRVKRFLFSKNVADKTNWNSLPLGKMRAAHSTGDIRTLANMARMSNIDLCQSYSSADFQRRNPIYSRSCEGDYVIPTSPLATSSSSSVDDDSTSEMNSSNGSYRIVHSSSLDESRISPILNRTRHQSSIEEAYTTSATCIAHALSANCDVTIVVTPPAGGSQEVCDRLISTVKLNGIENTSIDEKYSKISNDTSNSDDETDSAIQKSEDTITSPKCRRKPRPPPPSYPPPLLPSKVVFNL